MNARHDEPRLANLDATPKPTPENLNELRTIVEEWLNRASLNFHGTGIG